MTPIEHDSSEPPAGFELVATALPLACRLPSTTSAAAGIAPAALFGSFFGTTQQSDFPRL